MTTTVAIAAQYASGNPTSRPSNIDIVAAIAVRKACDIDGRFSLFQVQNFIKEIIFRSRFALARSQSFISKEIAATNS
jgi:hypothetical protein